MIGLALAALVGGCGDDGGGTGEDAGPDDGGADTGTPDDGGPGDGAPPVDGGGDDAGGGECALPAPFDEGVSYETTLWIAPDGDDAADGTESAPLATLEEAASRAGPGTRIVMTRGTYPGDIYIGDLQGEEGRPIAIVADGEVVIDAAGAGEALHLSEARWLVLEGLTIEGAATNGLNIDDGGSYDTPAEHIVLRDLTVRNVGSGGNNDCIKLSGVDRFFVLDSDISSCDAGDAIDMVGCHEAVVSGNRIHDTVGSGGIQMKGGSADNLVHGNWFENVDGRSINAGGSTGLDFFRPSDAPHEAARLRIVANVFLRSGANSGAPIAYVGCDACVFANNTLAEPVTWVARILQESTDARFVPSRDGLFVNNLIVLNVDDLRTFVNVGSDTAPETFTFGWNLWYALDRGADWTGPTYSGGVPPEQMSIIQMDPVLVDYDGDRLQPTSPSPAFRAGRPLDGPAFPAFNGNCYPDPPTIGAFTLASTI